VTAPVRRRSLPPLRSGAEAADVAGRPSLLRLFTVGASALSLLGIVAIALGAVALAGLTSARADLLDTAVPAVDAGQRLSIALLDQETGVRGFGLTGREEFLDPYRSGRESEGEALAALGAGPDVAAVREAAQRWREQYAEPAVAAARTGAPGPDALTGRALFDQVRVRSDVLVDRLQADEAAARGAVGAASSFVLAAAAAVAGVLLAVLVVASLGLRRTVLTPVADLAAQVRAVVSGERVRAVAVAGPREIAQLGADIEAMRLRIVRDLDESREINRRLDEQAQELARSNRDLEQFAYVASHDLQEPLRKVSSFCQLLQRRYGGQLDDRADQYIGFAVDGAQRMQQLINDLLAFSRVGRTTEGFVPVPLGDVVAAARNQLDAVREDTGGEIVVGDLPTVDGDPALLRQLFVNLLGNGLKFHREGVPPVVRVDARARDGEWEITVADNGIGVDAEYAEKVFVIFQRLHARDRYPGTGIGLALAKKIAEFHGGRIRIAPSEGPGATIVLTLPASGRPEHHD
jgi:signal transduction histidine kinase